MRRNVLVARALANAPLNATPLMIAGAPEAADVSTAAGVPCLTLPPFAKCADGHYTSRSLAVKLADLVALRSGTIEAALDAFDPDVFVVDNVPRGAACELDATLGTLRRNGRTRCVLGLRDVLDAPHTVRREWREARNIEAIHDFYDEVWIYGDPSVYDAVRAYGFPNSVATKTRYVGYLDPRARLASTPGSLEPVEGRLSLPDGTLSLCVVGGGQDGDALALAFAEAERPADMNAVIVTGPFMPAAVGARLHRLAAEQPRLRVLGFIPEPLWLLRRADRVIAMGGYNTVCEILSFAKPALIVPRVTPRREQAIRAERMRDLGLLEVVSPDALTPQVVGAWLHREPRRQSGVRVDLNGLLRVAHLFERLVARGPVTTGQQRMLGVAYGA